MKEQPFIILYLCSSVIISKKEKSCVHYAEVPFRKSEL